MAPCTVALAPGGSTAEIQILLSFLQSDGSSNRLVSSQLEHRDTSIYKFYPHFQGLKKRFALEFILRCGRTVLELF